MTSYTWTGNGGGDSWNNDDNWSTSEDDPALSTPGGGDLVYFSSPATITDSGSADDVTLTSTLELDGGTITVTTNTASTFYVDYGGMLSVVSSGSIDAQAMYAEGSADFDDGTLTISNFLAVEGGEVTIENGASLTASTANPNDSCVLVGYAAEGVLTVKGKGSSVTTSVGGLNVGSAGGTGYLYVDDGASVSSSESDPAVDSAIEIGYTGTGYAFVSGAGSTITTTNGNAAVGTGGSVGQLTIEMGAAASFTSDPGTPSLWSGYQAGSEGTVTITGPGSSLTTNGGGVGVGFDDATGFLTIDDGASATLSAPESYDSLDIGGFGGTGSVTVSGSGSSLDTNARVAVGLSGTGYLTIDDSGSFTSSYTSGASLDIGVESGAEGTMTVSDDGTALNFDNGDGIIVGDQGTGSLEVDDGATFTVASATPDATPAVTLGNNSTGNGTLTIDGADSTFTAGAGGLVVGDSGTGALNVEKQGALKVSDDVTVGAQSTGMGTVTLSAGGTADISGSLTIGQASTGGGGSSFGTGHVIVGGSGSTLTADDITVGGLAPDPANPDNGEGGTWTYTGGIGTLEVDDNANVMIDDDLTLQGSVQVGDASSAVGGVKIMSGGGMDVGDNAAAPADTLQIDDDGTLIGHGQITGAVTGANTPPTYSLGIDNEGAIRADDGVLALDGNASGGGQYLVGDDSTLEFGGTVDDEVTVMFLPGDDETIAIDDPDDFHGVISSENFTPDDKIDLPNVPYVDPGSADLNPDGASFYFETGEQQPNYVLQVVEDDQTYNIPISEDDDDAALNGGFTLSDDGRGGTLVTYMDDAVTDYSETATADGPKKGPYAGVVRISYSTSTILSNGSGFAVGTNLILTAYHVVEGAPIIKGRQVVTVYLPSGGKTTGYVVAHGKVNFFGVNVPSSAPLATSGDWAYVFIPGKGFQSNQLFSLNNSFSGGKVTVTGYPGAGKQYSKIGKLNGPAGSSLNYGSGLFPLARGYSGGPTWIYNGNHFTAVGINDTQLSALNVASVPPPSKIHIPASFYKDPPSDAARITSAVTAQAGDVDTGRTAQLVLDMSENVVVIGDGPTLTLNDGGVATYNAANSTGTQLEFDYAVGSGDQTSNLEITGASSTNTVQAPGGAGIDFSVLDDQPTNLSINSPLVVQSVASSKSGEVGAGASVQLTLTMSEGVTVDTAGGAPTLLLDDNATATYDAAASNPSAGKLVFDYTVGADDATPNLEVASVNLPTGTTVTDAAGYNADFSAADDVPTGLQVGPAYITTITPSQSGELATGQTLQLTLAMSQAVTVDTSGGSPTLSLSDGADATYDAAASNPSAGALVFDYTVRTGDYATDLQVLGYKPNGATITDAHGVTAGFSRATDDDLALDVNAAIVTNMAARPSTGEADNGQQITLTLMTNEPVTVDLAGGSPTLTLNDGATATYDDTASNPSADSLVFDYTVGASDETPNLQISQFNLNGATINDANGNSADLSAAANITTNLQIGPAFVSSVTPSLTGDIFTGQTDQITLAMSQAVTVDTTNGSPTLSLSDGADATYDAAASDPSTGALVFDYTVGANDYTTDLTALGYNPNGAAVDDANGVSANFSNVAGDDLAADVNAAIVTDVTASPSTGEADSGAEVALTLTMSEAVSLDTTNGSPTLSLSSGGTATYDSVGSDPSEGSLVFDYTVGATDATDDLQVIQANLNGATIDDASGHTADLSAAADFDTGLQIGQLFVESVTPSLSGDLTAGQTVELSVAMSGGLTVDTAGGSPTLSLSDGAVATYDDAASDPSTGALVFDYKVASSDYAVGLSVTGFNPDGATVTDANGVDPDFSGLAQSDLRLDVNATTLVNIAVSAPSGTALDGQQVLVAMTLSGPVTVNTAAGSPTLYMSDGAVAKYDAAASNPSTGELVFSFTVRPGDYTRDLAIAKFNLRGATILDDQGHAPDFGMALGANTGLEVNAACYGRGTRLATPGGYVAIEELREGELALTASGATRPIRWIGHRIVDISRHPDPAAVRPVRVSAGAFGEGLPQRDLWLSPGHNVASEGALMPISCLINGRSVAQINRDRVEYWHVELDAHDVLLAEGLPAESYLDTGNRTAFVNGGAFIEAHPDFKPKHWAETCLPLVKDGAAIARTKTTLIALLVEQGHEIISEADARIVVDGLKIDPIRLSDTRFAFMLPDGGQQIVLRSNTFVPAHAVAESSDFRELGLCIGRLLIDGSALALDDDETYAIGWREVEVLNGRFSHRWTTGATPLPAGARIVIIDIAGDGHYWRVPENNAAARYG